MTVSELLGRLSVKNAADWSQWWSALQQHPQGSMLANPITGSELADYRAHLGGRPPIRSDVKNFFDVMSDGKPTIAPAGKPDWKAMESWPVLPGSGKGMTFRSSGHPQVSIQR